MINRVFQYAKSLGLLNALFLFCYLINLLNFGFIFGYLLIATILIKRDFVKKNLDFDLFLLFLFSLCYGLFYALNPDKGIQFIFIYIFTPAGLYLWGKYMAFKAMDTRGIIYLLLGMGIIISLPALVSVLLNIMQGGFVQGQRNIPMIWSDSTMNATGMAALFTLNMCIPAVLVASYRNVSRLVKIFLVGIFVLSIACVLRLGSRTQLVITMFTFLITLIYVMPKQTTKQNVTLFGLLAVAGYFVFRNVSFDLNADWLSSFAGRLQKGGTADIASGGGRTYRWMRSLENMFEKPLGWSVDEFGYAHNLWLDVLREGGVIVFLLLIIFSVRCFKNIRGLVRQDPGKISFNTVIFTFFLAFMLLFMVEPIIDGSFQLFAIFCMFMGIANYQYQNNQDAPHSIR